MNQLIFNNPTKKIVTFSNPTFMQELYPSDAELKQCWDYLDKLPPGSIKEVSAIAPNKPELFIECVKRYINTGGQVEFNSTYKKIKRLNPIL